MRPWLRRSAENRRRRALRGAIASDPASPLTAYLSVPFVNQSASVGEADFLALDLETTGRNPARDRILAVGFVPIVRGRIVLAEARSVLVAAEGEVGVSATIHGITDDDAASGVPLTEALTGVLEALTGRVLLAHHAAIEAGFLGSACRAVWGASAGFEGQIVDTMALQRRLVSGGFHQEAPPGSLRLWTARERYGLPVYRAHDPLVDALACAELFLAQVSELAGSDPSNPPSGVSLKGLLG